MSERIPRKPGQPAKSDKHSDLYTDEDPKGTIHGLKFATPDDAKASVSKIKSSGRSHAHKMQAAIAMEQRAKVMGKAGAAAVYRSFINSMKDKTEEMREATDLKDRFKKYIKPTVKTTPKMERIANPAGRTTDHVEYKVTGPTGMVRRFKSKREAQAHYSSFTEQEMWETWSQKYKKSIDCSNPKGFSQRAHCQGRKKKMKEHIEEAVKMTALEKFRKAAAEREKKHDDAEKEMKARHAAGKENMSGAIDRLEKHLNKEEIIKTKTGLIHKGKYGTEYSDKNKGRPRKNAMDLTTLNKSLTNRLEKSMGINFRKEDSPTNAAGTGAIAGLGVGPQGEPGVNMKKKKKVIPFAMFTRKMPN